MLFCQNLQLQPGHILGQGNGKAHFFSGEGVEEGQIPRVEGGPGDQVPVLCAVEKIPGEGVAGVGHVDPNLMGAARLQLQRHQ